MSGDGIIVYDGRTAVGEIVDPGPAKSKPTR